MNSETISRIRLVAFGLTGLTCLIYGGLSVLNGQPDPFHPAIPGLMGAATAIILLLTAFGGDAAGARIAWEDEGYKNDTARAAQIGYWIALFNYPVFAALLYFKLLNGSVAFAAMGTFTAAAFLLSFVYLDLKGR